MTLISEITPQPTRTAIDEHLEGQQTPRHSNRLGGSVIGKKCSRELFYGFRWAFPAEKFKGRILRLFGVGHQLEAEFSNYIRNTGANVYELDPVTGKQFEVNAIGGHVVGFLDGKGIGLAEAPKQMHLIEYKTHNDKSFKDLVKKGLQVSKPEHYAQMQT